MTLFYYLNISYNIIM